MKDKTTRFLSVSIVLVVILCVVTFSFLAVFMGNRSSETISDVGNIYMTGMSEQISLHFETTIDLRLSQVAALTESVQRGTGSAQALRGNLAYNAQARGFEALAFYSGSGDFDMLYGEEGIVTDPDSYLASLSSGEKKVAVGTTSDGERVVLLGIPASYPMENGEESIALVATLPVSYISDTLSLNEDGTLTYSHVISRDGSFVIRSGDAFRDNYFDRIRAIFDDLNGASAETYVKELTAAMDEDKDYSAVLDTGMERRHLYCTKLAYSEWYLVTVMPYGTLDESVNRLSQEWLLMAFAGCAIVLAALGLVFFTYLRLSRQQMRALEAARQAAVEAEREAWEANKAKSEFLSNMSHDIRTPMNAIVGMTAIATANMDDPQQVQNCLRKITLSSKHLLGLINDVLDMSKIESGKLTLNTELVSLREVMDNLVNIAQPQVRAKHQKFDVFLQDITVENVCCDSVRLNQILLNLMSNAIKFTPEEGSIQVSLREEASPRGADYIRIHLRVKDNGIGMAPEFREKIFESFSREDRTRVHRTEGTGLGMAITKYIVDAMHGTIQVESEQGKGSEFYVVLDLEKAEVQEADMILPEWNMLVVDDDQQLCKSTVDALHTIGIRADWTLDGESAVKMVTEQHQKHDDYQIILLDWKLPGMDGIETAREIRRHLEEDIPILLISAYDWSEIEKEARDAGISGFISKPLFKSTLFYGLRPFAGDAAGNLPELPEEEQIDFTGRHVLLAEDNELNWEIAHELLSELGLELEWAENGQICVEKFQAAPPGTYDAILMDIRMPVMTGYEAARAIRALDRPDAGLPIIAMTADAFSEDIKKVLDCGMNAHVAKPIDIKELARLLEKFMKEQPSCP